jgi:20S proteasome subunit alpha 2
VRPFGVSLLIAGYDEVAGAQLYQVDPSGSYWAWKASAIGKGMVNARTFLEKRYARNSLSRCACVCVCGVCVTVGVLVAPMLIYICVVLRIDSYKEDVGLEDAVHTAILTLKEGFEGEMTENNIELSVVNVIEGKPVFRVLTPAEVKDYLGEVQ